MLETIHEFSREKLEESAETGKYKEKHADYFLQFAQKAASKLKGDEQPFWVKRLEEENDNLRAALDWSISESGDLILGIRLAATIYGFWEMHNHAQEARTRMLALISQARATKPEVLHTREGLAAMTGAARMNLLAEDVEVARTLYEESLEIARERGNREEEGNALTGLGHIAKSNEIGNYDLAKAQAYFEQALAIRRSLGNPEAVGRALGNLAEIAYMTRDYQWCEALLSEAIAIQRAVGNRWAVASRLVRLAEIAGAREDWNRMRSLCMESLDIAADLEFDDVDAWAYDLLGELERVRGDYDAATAWQEKALQSYKKINNNWGLSRVIYNQAKTSRDQRDYGKAMQAFGRSLEIDRHSVGWHEEPDARFWLLGYATIAEALGQHETAAKLLATVDKGASLGLYLSAIDWREYEQTVGKVQHKLGENAWERERAEGDRLTVEDALILATDEIKVPEK
jgi:tetratricopeptide (TPR) repeat protein